MSTPNNNIAVSIGGKPLFSFKSLKLHQPVNDHHRFELTLDIEVAAKALKDGTEWLGKRIQFKKKGAKSPLFIGVVTKVNAYRKNLDSGYVGVSGYSTTYLLENGKSCHSWIGRTLGEIVKELCAKAGVQAQVAPEHNKPVGYICQYRESDFMFIRRLAMKYQEWLYYDGAKLVFGKPKKPKAVKLEFDTTLTSFEMGVQTLARPARVFSYQSKNDHSMAENTPNKPSGLDQLGSKAFQASLEMFKEPALQYAHSRVHHMQEMEMYVKKKQEAEAAESHYMVGTSEEAQLTAGSVVRITSPFGERIGSVTKASLGEYLIIDIEHSVGEGNYYANRFRAIPSGVQSLPLPDVELAVAETQMARVTSNADPEGKGRVQVQMNWQTGNMHTDWIRGLTPDGGSSDNVGANRGFVFIPEVGDHVLVGFRHNDPNRPYIMGSLFNGKTGKGGGEGNNTKSITTKSGSTIKLDDSSGSIFIADKTGKNLITIDGTDAITMLSAKTVTLSNGKSSITIEDEKVTISAKEVNITGESSIVCTSGESDSLAIAKGKGVGVKGKDISIQAKNIVGTSGGNSATVSSPSTSISGDANVTIDGGLVKINS
jgi:phage-related baseplate assembly protein